MHSAAPVLDDAQRSVVQLPPDASGVVIGAPGTGKTRALAERVAWLGEQGIEPDDIVVLTPSRTTATRLRDELGVRVGRATAGPLARSVGSFAFQLVRERAVRRGEEPPRLLTGADQDRIVADILAGDEEDAAAGRPRWPDGFGQAVRRSRGFRSELRAFIAECTELGVEPEELAGLGGPLWRAIAAFVSDYRNVLVGMRTASRDASELTAEAAAILRSRATPFTARAVLIDDAQELTRGGIGIVRALAERGVAVLAFGDPDIGSGAFRGVTPELFAQLAALLGEVHVLEAPHRQAGGLTTLTRTVTQAIGAGGRVEHRRPPGRDDPAEAVEVFVAPSPYEEIDRIAWTLRDWHLTHQVPWQHLAVIAHDTRQITRLETELAAREVPVRAAGVQHPLGQQGAVRDLVEVVRLALQQPDERDPDALLEALRSPFGGLDGVGVRRLRARLRHAELEAGGTRPARELLREALAETLSLTVDTPEARAASRFAETLASLHRAARGGATIHELLWEAWDRARTADGRRLSRVWYEQSNATGPTAAETSRALDGLVALFDAAKRFVERAPQEGPGPFIRDVLDSDVPEDTLTAPERAGTVALLTPAMALGTEFEAVVVAGVQEGVWPNVRVRGGMLATWSLADVVRAARSGQDDPPLADVLDRRRAALHDELRLFARAVSRARRRILVTAVDDDDSGPSPLLSFLPDPAEPDERRTEHPLTLRGLVARHRRTLTTTGAGDPRRDEAAAQLAVLAREGVPGADPQQWYGVRPRSTEAPLIDAATRPVRVSPSRLEGFEACGLDWAIRALGGDTRTWSAGLGTILHAAVEEARDGDLDALEKVVEQRWGELDFEAPWLERKERIWAGKLLDRLRSYLGRFALEQGEVLGAESRFELEIPLGGEPEVRALREDDEPAAGPRAVLSGSIDRVERYPSGKGEDVPPGDGDDPARSVVIVDLKTGRSESRVTDSSVETDAQLAAYQLAYTSGAVSGADPADRLAGSRLLVVSRTRKGAQYRIAHQPALAPEAREAFLRRVSEAAAGMAAARFVARIDDHCRDDRFAVCRMHTVKAVSAS